ncbi:hypothetical protein [Frigoriglobus tundricola]|uniref:hypothetical protein n=1 Tax=Frigoriglobus tundricola TaxID=2774151 RepID=UPI001D090C98|nr:hypothetical protein [Frigoriglobus tundricola]
MSYCTRLLDRTGVMQLRDSPGQSLFQIDRAKERVRMTLANTLRDIFGNPFRPFAADPSWLAPSVTALVRQMYESWDFTAIPVLADALEDAGCGNDDILNHCRGPGPHVRGCWVVDALLNKE